MLQFSLDLGFMVFTQQDIPMLVNFCIAVLIAAVGLYYALRRDRDSND